MFLFIGLGNPEKKYFYTRHNAGWSLLDFCAKIFDFPAFRAQNKFKSFLSEGEIAGLTVCLAKPTTYMNNSGEAVYLLRNYFRLSLDNLLVVHDELDLPFGALRLSLGGSSAGHKGIASIIERLSDDRFARLRLGIGRPSNESVPIDQFVLSNFSFWERLRLKKEIFPGAMEKIESFLSADNFDH